MSKPRGCKLYKHVECEYNGCRGRVVARGHAEDCPFQPSDDEDSGDWGGYSESEKIGIGGGWKPVRVAKKQPVKPATTTGTRIVKPTAVSNTANVSRAQAAKQPSSRMCTSNAPVRPPSNPGVRTIASGGISMSAQPCTDRPCAKPTKESWAQVASGLRKITVTARVKSTGTPKQSTVTPKESTTSPLESNATPKESTATPKESTATPKENTSAPTGSAATPNEGKITPEENTRTPTGSTATPKESTATPKESLTTPKESTATPKETTITSNPRTGAGASPEKLKQPKAPTRRNKTRRG